MTRRQTAETAGQSTESRVSLPRQPAGKATAKDLNAALALLGATAVLVAIPGPNVALIIANTIARGFRTGAATVFGTPIGIALQLAIVVLGLAALLEYAAAAFLWLKWLGAAYLIFLGVRSWRIGTAGMDEAAASRKPVAALVWQGMLPALINPKTLLFNAAFLPQFVSTQAGAASLLPAAAIYLCVMFLGDLAWAATAQSARPLVLRMGRLRHRLTGGLFVGSGVGLAFARTSS
jgi:threonine/homoserine/homoserine lactone efflux protein